MAVRIARIYDETAGHRVLVDRLWPRGVAKAGAPWHEWRKDLAPSDTLRKAFHSGEIGFDAFRNAYRMELERAAPPGVDGADVVLVTAAKDPARSHASVLREWLEDG